MSLLVLMILRLGFPALLVAVAACGLGTSTRQASGPSAEEVLKNTSVPTNASLVTEGAEGSGGSTRYRVFLVKTSPLTADDVTPPPDFSPLSDYPAIKEPAWERLGIWERGSDAVTCHLEARGSRAGFRPTSLGLDRSDVVAVAAGRAKLLRLSAICGERSSKQLEDF